MLYVDNSPGRKRDHCGLLKRDYLLHWGRFVDKKCVATPLNVPEKITPKKVLRNASRCTKKNITSPKVLHNASKCRSTHYLDAVSAALKHLIDSA